MVVERPNFPALKWSATLKPKIFIASSSEHLDLAYAAQEGLEHDLEATVWSQSIFTLSQTTAASLIDVLDESDFGLFILAPDDVASIRDATARVVRDNVIFELGLFVGRLASDRCFIFLPNDCGDLHLPTDLLGITPAMFDADRQDGNLVAALGPACNRVRKAVAKLGRVVPTPTSAQPIDSEQLPALTTDPNDCISLIESWMGARAARDNTRVIRYEDVDRELRMAAGSARLYLEEAAKKWNYSLARKGADTIMFQDANRHGASYF